MSSADFFPQKILSRIPSEIKQLDPDQAWHFVGSEYHQLSNSLDPDQLILLGLISVQTVCKSYQQMTLAGKELNTLKMSYGPRRKNTCLQISIKAGLHPVSSATETS